MDRRARGCRCAPAPGAPRATSRPGASALPRGPGSAPPRGRCGAPIAAARQSAWSKPRTRRRHGWVGTGTSTAGAASRPGGAPATTCAAMASATPSAPRNFSACTSARAGPSKATGAQARATAEPRDGQRSPHGAGSPQRGQRAPAQEAQLGPARPAQRLAHRDRRAAGPARRWGEGSAQIGEQMADGGEHPAMLARRASRLYRAIATILRSGCGRFVDVRPGCPGADRPGDGGLRPALAPRPRPPRPARGTRRADGGLRRRPARARSPRSSRPSTASASRPS